MENMEIWNKVRTPDPKYTKDFNRGGGFKGSATNTQYSIQRATELWGPNGTGWGVVVTDEKYVPGAPIIIDGAVVCNETIHVVRGFVWYTVDGERKESSEQFGQTVFVGKNKYGVFTDEEAPKKSVSDMMLKCLSLLGFSADIFLGLWDDNKYVNDVKAKVAEENKEQQSSTDTKGGNSPILQKWLDWVDSFTAKNLDEFTVEWEKYTAAINKLPAAELKKLHIARNEMITFLMEKSKMEKSA